MKVLIYINKSKEKTEDYLKKLIDTLSVNKIEYSIVFNDVFDNETYDAMFVIGGDGTILRCVQYAEENSLPIIGLNAGHFGFLTEFEASEIEEAVILLKDNKLKKDYRSVIAVNVNGINYHALNDVVLQRCFFNDEGLVISADIFINGIKINSIIGDGVILSTPTGSTAYSLSAGGSFLSPELEAFSITPLAAHSLSQRPIVYSSLSTCEFVLSNGGRAGVFIDGKFVTDINNGDRITIQKAKNPIVFLRKPNFNFFSKLYCKLKNKSEGNSDE